MTISYWAGHYIGLPFVEHGRTVYGLDCWGLVRLILFEQFDIVTPSYIGDYTTDYSNKEIQALIVKEAHKYRKIAFGSESCGDIIVTYRKNRCMHLGLIVGDLRMIHIERHFKSTLVPYTKGQNIAYILRHPQLT